MVPAVGGTREVPAPDPIAEEYLLLALRLDQRIPGLVDGYFGPAALKARIDTEQLRAPARLRGSECEHLIVSSRAEISNHDLGKLPNELLAKLA